ncbi:MAG: hypothetical protein IJK54_03380 [Clostridia bacterium]|nr:hypothetical protein [Clostridia bacterium]
MKKHPIMLICIISALAVCIALAILLPTVIMPAIRYERAKALYDAGQYEEAIAAFETLNGYRDSAERARAAYASHEIVKIREAEVGDYVTFGAYEQDNDASNGKESIEWLVLEKDGDSVLVISRYALDCLPYHDPRADMTWENCSLRAWLNETFLDDAFSINEQDRIRSTRVKADRNPMYTTIPAGNDTEDKVFLLSIPEAGQYMDGDSVRQCEPTAYANSQSEFENICTANGYCLWWLRTPGIRKMNVAFVDSTGHVSCHGYGVDHANTAVRPAMWIDTGER